MLAILYFSRVFGMLVTANAKTSAIHTMKTPKLALLLAVILVSLPFYGHAQKATTTTGTLVTIAPESMATLSGLIAMDIASATGATSSTSTMSVGETAQTQMLLVMTLLILFGTLHNTLIGVKLKKKYYDTN